MYRKSAVLCRVALALQKCKGHFKLKLLWLSELHLFRVSHDCSAFAVLDHQFWKQNVAIRISM